MPLASRFTVGSLALVAFALAACSDQGSLSNVPTAPTSNSSNKHVGGNASAAGGAYVMTNGAAANSVLAFQRAADGSLTAIGSVATGGQGVGGTVDPLQSQYSVILDASHGFLFVVNAGSNDVSSFRVNADASLDFVDRTTSGGSVPVSLARNGHFLYVLNKGDNTVSGIRVNPNGKLISVPGSTRSLAAGAAGASTIHFTPDGSRLVVTERAANRIETFAVSANGRLGNPVVTASNGAVPFGMDVTPAGYPIVTEAGGGSPPNGALSSYLVGSSGSLQVVTGSLDAGGKASCWVILTADGRFAFVANSASDAIAAFSVSSDATLALLDSHAGTTPLGAIPIDLDLSSGDEYLYTLDGGSGNISMFGVGAGGTLTALGATAAGAASSGLQGMAAW